MRAESGKRYCIIQSGRVHWKFDASLLPEWHDGLQTVDITGLVPEPAEGEPDQTYRIEQHSPKQKDAALLLAKANGAAEKGWSVEWTGPTSFVATKDRWGGVLCTRTFWIE